MYETEIQILEYRKILGLLPVGEASYLNRFSNSRDFINGYYNLYCRYHKEDRPNKKINPFFEFLGNPTSDKEPFILSFDHKKEVVTFVSIHTFVVEFAKALRIKVTERSTSKRNGLDLVTSSRKHVKESYIEFKFYLEFPRSIGDDSFRMDFNANLSLFHITLCKTNQRRGGTFLYETHSSNKMTQNGSCYWDWSKSAYDSYEKMKTNHLRMYNEQIMPNDDTLTPMIIGTGSFFYKLMICTMMVLECKIKTNQVSKMICSSCHRSPGAEKLWSRSMSLRHYGNVKDLNSLMKHRIKADAMNLYAQPNYYLLDRKFHESE